MLIRVNIFIFFFVCFFPKKKNQLIFHQKFNYPFSGSPTNKKGDYNGLADYSFLTIFLQNIFTIAGVGQDGAVALLLVSIISVLQNEQQQEEGLSLVQPTKKTQTDMLLQILLFAQLYKLGESSVDEIISAMGNLTS